MRTINIRIVWGIEANYMTQILYNMLAKCMCCRCVYQWCELQEKNHFSLRRVFNGSWFTKIKLMAEQC